MNSEPQADSAGKQADPVLPAACLPGEPPRLVVIGASAGGLDALEKLFTGLSPELGAAFIVIQHLSPDHKSMMRDLLARHTRMPVTQVEDDMPIVPNQVYLIPPGAVMSFQRGHLRLSPKSTNSLVLPIDIFLQSLAMQNGQNAIVVILSGSGSDGARGAVAIHEAGGLLLVQDPAEAKFDGMPRSVIDTGLVDYVLPVAAIPARISAYLRLPPIVPGWGAGRLSCDQPASVLHPDAALAGILHLLLQLGGIDFDEYKTGTVLRRIERRMAACQVSSIQAYFDLLNQDRAEAMTLRHELLISVTSFFRDPDAYAALASQVIAPLVANAEAGRSIRVWCAGVSTGEEAYSIAMLFLEAFERAECWPGLKIFATDIEQGNIEIAAAGSYPESIAADISPERLQRFFHPRSDRFVVRSELRQCLVFAQHNLLVDPPFTKMDLVVCRNALIYLRNGAQDKVLRRLQYALAPKGCLFLGSSESLGELQRDFLTLSARHKIWQLLRPSGALLDLRRSAASPHPVSVPGTQALHAQRLRRIGHSVVDHGHAALLKGFGPPPAVLVNSTNELIHAYGEVGPFLQIRDGQATLDIMRILAAPLVPVAAALLFKSAREGSCITSDAVRLKEGEEGSAKNMVRLSALPAGELDGQPYTLLVFERVNLSERSDARLSLDIGSETAERLAALEHELAATRESLVATIEELETTNEELESANEELQATNEEMMASNEELQSSNEELQSVNEELNTLNVEYEKKIDVLNRINADLDNLTKVVATSTIFVDEELTLVRFSPEAGKIFRLRDTDLGRSIEDLNHQLDYPELFDDLRATLASGQMLRKDVPGPAGRYFMVRMQPYNIALTSHRGVVLGLVEVTELYQSLERLQQVIDALDEHIAVLDSEGLILKVNRSWSESVSGSEVCGPHALPGQNYLEVCQAATGAAPGHWAGQALAGLREVLAGRQQRFVMPYCDETASRWFALHASHLDGANPGAVICHVDLARGCSPGAGCALNP